MSGGKKMSLTKAESLKLYEGMARARNFEQQVYDNFGSGLVYGFVHPGIGEEAVPAGVCAHLEDKDYLCTYHRGHNHMLLKGLDSKKMFAEICGKVTGYNRGKGGSQHISDMSLGVIGSNGIVGAGQLLAVGPAIKSKIKGTDEVSVVFFGDGASNEGAFHESLNFASAQKLPVVYILLNNLYAISTKQVEATNVVNLADRAYGYGIPGVVVDGNDVFAVYDAAKEAVERARRGEGPTLIECKTYRWTGHFVGDPCLYRTNEELEEWKKKDPLIQARTKLIEEGIATAEELDAIEKAAVDEMLEAVKFAEESPFPENVVALEDVYTDIVEEGR